MEAIHRVDMDLSENEIKRIIAEHVTKKLGIPVDISNVTLSSRNSDPWEGMGCSTKIYGNVRISVKREV